MQTFMMMNSLPNYNCITIPPRNNKTQCYRKQTPAFIYIKTKAKIIPITSGKLFNNENKPV
jgi:hypothetical protein